MPLPSEAAYRVFLGEMLVGMGCLQEAVEVFERALAEAHVGPVEEILFNQGCALRGLGRLEEAEVQFRLALARCPDYEDALVALEDVVWRG
jgi:tetratricopeptide (TPR) repeat protein